MKKFLAIAMFCLGSGCASFEKMDQDNLAQLSAARVGCLASDITTKRQGSYSWVAVCQGKTWICSGGSSISCHPLNNND